MKIKFWCSTHDSGSSEEDICEIEEYGFEEKDLENINAFVEKELDAFAEEYFYQAKEPCYGWEIVED